MLAAQGFAVYILHYFDRSGIESADKPTIFRNFPLWMKTLWDAISFVETQPQVDRERIALLGFSLGAYLSLANSTIDSRVRVVVDFFGGLPKEMKLFMRRLCPVLILHGEADATVPVEEAYELQKLLEKKGIAYEIQIYLASATVSTTRQFGAMQVCGACNSCRNIFLPKRRYDSALLQTLNQVKIREHASISICVGTTVGSRKNRTKRIRRPQDREA